jgi:predicted nucleotidyltransferase
MNFINQHKKEISNICQQHHVKELFAFGSVVDSNKFNIESDVDLIVKFSENIPVESYADLYFDLADQLEVLFDRKVDLMIKKVITNKFLNENIEETKKLIYEA